MLEPDPHPGSQTHAMGEAAGEADAVTLAAETAMQEEDGGDAEAAPEPEARTEGEDAATAALGDEEHGNRADGPAAGRRRAPTAATARAGRHWWSGAWMGRVATDDFAAAWGGRFGGPLDTWRTERTTRASDTAMRVGEAGATHTTRVAARTAAAEAQRRGRTLQLALADGRATAEERAATVWWLGGEAAWRCGGVAWCGRMRNGVCYCVPLLERVQQGRRRESTGRNEERRLFLRPTPREGSAGTTPGIMRHRKHELKTATQQHTHNASRAS